MDEKKVSSLQSLIERLGFPIAVAGWLLYERWTMLQSQSETLQRLTETINQNSEVVRQLMDRIGGQ